MTQSRARPRIEKTVAWIKGDVESILPRWNLLLEFVTEKRGRRLRIANLERREGADHRHHHGERRVNVDRSHGRVASVDLPEATNG